MIPGFAWWFLGMGTLGGLALNKSRLFLLVSLSGTLGGCAGFSLPGVLNSSGSGASLNPNASYGTDVSTVTRVRIEGTVTVPSLIANNAGALNSDSLNPSSLIAHNANALVGNNANALIANNANALVGNNANALGMPAGIGPAFRVAAVAAQPVEKMFVAAFNEKLAPVSQLALTDSSGKFSLEIPQGVVLIEAVRGQARQLGLAYSDARQVSIDLATTLVSAQIQATGKFASYGKADVDKLVAEIGKSATDADANALLGDDAALKNAFSSHATARTLFEQILSGKANPGGSSSGGNQNGGNQGSGSGSGDGTPTRTHSTIAVSTWPAIAPSGGNYVKQDQDGFGLRWLEINRAEGNATLAFVTHNSPNIKKGDSVRFNLKVMASSQPSEPGKYPAYLKFIRGDGTVAAKIGLYHTASPAGESVPPCNDSANSGSCVSGGGVFVPFTVTAPDDVSKLEFGGEARSYTAQLTDIEINP